MWRERVRGGEVGKKEQGEFQLETFWKTCKSWDLLEDLRPLVSLVSLGRLETWDLQDVQSSSLSLRCDWEDVERGEDVHLFRYIPLLYCLAGLLLCITLVSLYRYIVVSLNRCIRRERRKSWLVPLSFDHLERRGWFCYAVLFHLYLLSILCIICIISFISFICLIPLVPFPNILFIILSPAVTLRPFKSRLHPRHRFLKSSFLEWMGRKQTPLGLETSWRLEFKYQKQLPMASLPDRVLPWLKMPGVPSK